jgi:SAM-dependent methyltransferase
MKLISHFIYFKELWHGKDLYRIFMNKECENQIITGKVLDIGSGVVLASYHRFLKKEKDVVVECLDLGFENSGGKKIDLEKDFLPHQTESVDAVLLFNILEHLYNYSLVLSEIKRVLKPGGMFIGAVPFLVAYHPDPHDYWRFTIESLEKVFATAGFASIQIKSFGCGPISASFSQMEMILPRLLKIILLPGIFFCDWVITALRPRMNHNKFSLGLFFVVTK